MHFELVTCEPYDSDNIAVWCVSRETEEYTRIDVEDFEPYFYVHAEETERARRMREEGVTSRGEPAIVRVEEGWESIGGHPLSRVVLEKPGQTPEMREKFESPDGVPIDTWASDINYTMRFRVDTGIRAVFEIPEDDLEKRGSDHYLAPWDSFSPCPEEDPEIPPRNFYFDIEVGGEDRAMPGDSDLNPISCITGLDSRSDELVSWVWRDDWETEIESRQYVYDSTEYEGESSERRILSVVSKVYQSHAESVADFSDWEDADRFGRWVCERLDPDDSRVFQEVYETARSEWSEGEIHSLVFETESRLEDRLEDKEESLEETEFEYPWEIRRFDSEVKMLANFFSFFKDERFAILSGWYSDKYDVPYVCRRAEDIGLDPDSWSPMGSINDGIPLDSWGQAKVSGVFMNDLERRYDGLVDPSSSALDHVASEEEGLMTWTQESGSIQEIWESAPNKMLEYNANDVVATRKIDEKAGVTDFYLEKMYLTGCRVEEIERDSQVITYYLMFRGGDDQILPRAKVRTHKEFGGGRVILPDEQGVLGPIAVLDLSKIYPSIMISLGLSYENARGVDPIRMGDELSLRDEIPDVDDIEDPSLLRVIETNRDDPDEVVWELEEGDVVSPLSLGKRGRKEIWDRLYDMSSDGSLERPVDWEFVPPGEQTELDGLPDDDTIDLEEEGDRLPNGVRIDSDEEGLVSETLEEMFDLRTQFDDALESLDPSDPRYKEKSDRLSKKKRNAKDQVNAVFGYSGYKKSPLFRPEIAMTTTFVGRNILKMCERVAEALGHRIIYGDTDSVMVLLEGDRFDPEENIEECVYESHRIGELVNDRMDDFALNFCGLESDEHMFELEFEKLFARFFVGSKKKRYAGLKTVSE